MNLNWWKRNRLWLALAVPLVVLALAASSFRLFTLYLPWEWSAPTTPNASQGTLTQSYLELDGVQRDREVDVRVVSFEAHESYDGLIAVAGATLWRVELELTAAPDQFLEYCEIELADAAGNRYDFRSSIIPEDEQGFNSPPFILRCVPEDTPGPTLEPISDEVVEPAVERPSSWAIDALIAVPDGVTPTSLHIGWQQPQFLVLQLPNA